jgi:spoIIIJ-associated protein
MKYFTAKTLDEAINLAVTSLKVSIEELKYEVVEEKRGLFRKTATISVYELADAIEFAQNYIKNVLEAYGLDVTVKSTFRDGVIKLSVNSNSNPLLIGKNGKTLQALTELTRLATFSKFKTRYKLIVEIADYKLKKYKKITFLAKKAAREVIQTKATVKLDPMTSDERRVVHNVLAKFSHIETESIGEGKTRAVTIKYDD